MQLVNETHVPVSVQMVAAHGLYIHALPGRLRVEAPRIKGSPAQLRQLEQTLRALPGVLKMEGSALTGRVLVQYNRTQISERQILNLLICAGDLPQTGQQYFVANTVMGSIADFLVTNSLSLLVG
jgi:hypothetical protein